MFRFIILVLSLLFITTPQVNAQNSTPFKIIDSSDYSHSYAYAPSIIYDQGVYHVFFCSAGGGGGYDYIRYTHSTDGVTWSAPTVVITSSPVNGNNLAACDPSLVYFQGYYYLYYSGAYDTAPGVTQTVVHVARSVSITGPYEVYTIDGRWEVSGNPKILIYPFTKRDIAPPGYGAGQQAGIARDGKLVMWYNDDSVTKGSLYTYKVESLSPVDWHPNPDNITSIVQGMGHSMDVKYDPVSRQYAIIQIVGFHTSNSSLGVRHSVDGISWGSYLELASASSFPDFAHNAGLLSDREGHLLPDTALVAFGAPYDMQSTDTWTQWDLYGIWADLSLNPGDLNGDGHVNIFDYNYLVKYFGRPFTIFDFNAIIANFGH